SMPGRISPEYGVIVRKCSHGGVIKSRFCASEKNAKTFSRDCGNQSCDWKFRTRIESNRFRRVRLAQSCEIEGVTEMVAVRMRHQDVTRMIPSQILVFRGRCWVLNQERINQQMRSAGRHDVEDGVPEPGNRDRLLLVRRRRLRQRRSANRRSN